MNKELRAQFRTFLTEKLEAVRARLSDLQWNIVGLKKEIEKVNAYHRPEETLALIQRLSNMITEMIALKKESTALNDTLAILDAEDAKEEAQNDN
jgi:cell fate (sporulation/competence/biofilm development) regulator YmcA (YheA/YmcA/DUF963 family)